MIRRVNEGFIPVALKAAQLNLPPSGLEGRLYREIARSKIAPQGICAANSAGKVLAWSLMFDDDPAVLGFLDHVARRYADFPDASRPPAAERYMSFPGRRMDDVADEGNGEMLPDRHPAGERCPGRPTLAAGTLRVRVYGRALRDGTPVEDTRRQENYVEDLFEISPAVQEGLAGKGRFKLPEALVRSWVSRAYLGMLDVNPLEVASGRNERRSWEFWGRRSGDAIQVEGRSEVAGGQRVSEPGSDGRFWTHEVSLRWEGRLELEGRRVARLLLKAEGREKLRWNNKNLIRADENPVACLPGGRPIEFEGEVRYGFVGEPVPKRP